MFRRASRRMAAVVLLAGLVLGTNASPAHAASRVIVGQASSSPSCGAGTVAFEGVNISGNTWSFTFVAFMPTSGGCSVAEVGHVTGVWAPSSATQQNCVTGSGVGIFCLALPTTSGPLGTDPSVSFSFRTVTGVNGFAQVTQVNA